MRPAHLPVCLTLLLSAACSGLPGGPQPIVAVPVPAASSASVAALCRDLVKTLPRRLGRGIMLRDVLEPQRSAAWGEPPIRLTCGAAAPSGTFAPLILDGLPFTTVRRSDRVLWYTTDRAVTVLVDVPMSYQSQADVVVPLVPALKRIAQR